MNRDHFDKEQNNPARFRESDSASAATRAMDSRTRHIKKTISRFEGVNRFGESDIHHDSYQDDQFRNDYDPTYKDAYGAKHPYEHGGKKNRWSDDIRSESSRESHFGKGPKGYFRTDAKIYEDVCEMLTRSPKLDASEIDVEVKNGCVYLKGMVETRADKKLAENLSEIITGVRDVWNQLEIRRLQDNRWIEMDRGDHPQGPVKGLL